MLGKLLKYDLKYMIKNMGAFYVLAVFFAITTRILLSLDETTMISILTQVCSGFLFAMLANILINTIMRSLVRFRESIYKDEAYLTNTLPVTKNQIYNSKFLEMAIFYIVGAFIILLCLFIAYYTKDNYASLKELLSVITSGYGFNTLLLIISILLIASLEIINVMVSGFLGIILGHKKNSHKVLFSVIFGFIAYIVSQIIAMLSVFIVGIFNSGVMQMFNGNITPSGTTIKLLIILSITVYLINIILISTVSKIELNKGINIE